MRPIPSPSAKNRARFLAKTTITPTECWEWQAGLDKHGYGRFSSSQGWSFAHRVSYSWFVGPIQDGLTIDHLCRNPKCVNPAHLEAVSHRENMRRGIGFSGHNARKTHCKRGHEFTPENTYEPPKKPGRRHCRACRDEANRRRYQKGPRLSN